MSNDKPYLTDWRGASGEKYEFTMLPYQTLFPKSAGPPDVPEATGVYIFSRVEQGIRVPIYIGMSSNLNKRLNIEWHSHHNERASSPTYLMRCISAPLPQRRGW